MLSPRDADCIGFDHANLRFDQAYRRVLMHGDHPVPTDFYAFCRLEGRVGIERSDESPQRL